MSCFNLSKHADISALSSNISASLIEKLLSDMLGGMFCTVDVNQSVMSRQLLRMNLPVDRKGCAMSLDVEDTLCFTVDVHWPVTMITRRSMDLPPRRLITHPLQTAFRDWLSCMVMMSLVEIGAS